MNTATMTPWQLQAHLTELEAGLAETVADLDPAQHAGTECTCADDRCEWARYLGQLLDAAEQAMAVRPVPAYAPLHADCTRPDRDCEAFECGCGSLCPDECHRLAGLNVRCGPALLVAA